MRHVVVPALAAMFGVGFAAGTLTALLLRDRYFWFLFQHAVMRCAT
jgi:hypothetical protein